MRTVHRIQLRKVKQFVQNFNLFPSTPPSTDESILSYQRISTRFFVILLIWFLTILTLYNSLLKVTKSGTIKHPRYENYLQLSLKYPTTLTCPCSNITINYDKIMNVNYTFHQLCTSDFISEKWIKFVSGNVTIMYTNDFRGTASYLFRGLLMFCQSLNTSISGSLDRFYSSQYISGSLISYELFQTQMDSRILQFISSTTEAFLLSLETIRSATKSNALFTAYQTNYIFYLSDVEYPAVRLVSTQYGNCDCMITPECTQETILLRAASTDILYKVPGLNIGCYIIEALIQSTLECLYMQECVEQIRYHAFSSNEMINITALDSSLPSRYQSNTSMEIILNRLMVEQWNWSIIYKNYYEECRPYECTYTFEARNDIIYIVTIIIGLIGGLVKVLKITVPTIVKLTMNKRQSQASITGKTNHYPK